MTRAGMGLCIATGVMLWTGCGDDSGDDSTTADATPQLPADASRPDAPLPDASAPDAATVQSFYGRTCSGDGECGVGGFCLGVADDWPERGYCTRSCTADIDCGDGALCSDGTSSRLCYRACGPGDTCADETHMCASSFGGGFTDLGRPACVPGQLVPEAVACASFGDCRPTQACALDRWILPGGTCVTTTCTVGDDTTCAPPDGHCHDFGGGPTCIAACVADSDCRTAEGYRCYDSQTAQIGEYCAFLTTTGVGCTADSDCGPAPWECVIRSDLPGGYCSATGCDPAMPLNPAQCNVRDSQCHDPSPDPDDEFCVRTCTPASEAIDCRTVDGYSCVDLDGDGPGTVFGCLVAAG